MSCGHMLGAPDESVARVLLIGEIDARDAAIGVGEELVGFVPFACDDEEVARFCVGYCDLNGACAIGLDGCG